ncbi:MAG: hypothetical protein OEO21_12295 [Candidatus Krumholzibacteria bacterium]|nr:hypothetical protein [Candidatus Krumholzibacteria bacterium]
MFGSTWLRPLPLVTALALACAGGGEEATDARQFVPFGAYASQGDSLPRVRYFEDGQLSVNDRCAVRRTKLNPHVRPVWVNGHPVGFC